MMTSCQAGGAISLEGIAWTRGKAGAAAVREACGLPTLCRMLCGPPAKGTRSAGRCRQCFENGVMATADHSHVRGLIWLSRESVTAN